VKAGLDSFLVSGDSGLGEDLDDEKKLMTQAPHKLPALTRDSTR